MLTEGNYLMLGNIGDTNAPRFIYVNTSNDVVVMGPDQPGSDTSLFTFTKEDGSDSHWSISSQPSGQFVIPVNNNETTSLEAISDSPVYFQINHVEGAGDNAVYTISTVDQDGDEVFATMSALEENSAIVVQAADEEPKQKWKFVRPNGDDGLS